MIKLKLRKLKELAWYFRHSKWPNWNIPCLALSTKPSHIPRAMRDPLHIKTLLLTLSTNKPKNVTHVCCSALAARGAMVLLITYRYTCQDLLCIYSETGSRSPEIESHYYSARPAAITKMRMPQIDTFSKDNSMFSWLTWNPHDNNHGRRVGWTFHPGTGV